MKWPFAKKTKTPGGNVRERAFQTSLPSAPQALERAVLRPFNADLHADLEKLKARSRQEVQRGGGARSFVLSMEKNCVPMQLKSLHPNANVRNRVEQAFAEWAENPVDPSGDMSWHELQRVVIRDFIVDGESVIRLIPEGDYGIMLQPIDSARLATRANANKPDGTVVELGVEFDAIGRLTAYHFTDAPTANTIFPQGYHHGSSRTTRVFAGHVFHVFSRETATQVRGFPWMSATSTEFASLRHYQESELIAARISAKALGVITQDVGGETTYNPENPTETPPLNTDSGGVNELLPGQDMKAVNFGHPDRQYSDFVQANQRQIAAGLGITYEELSSDLSRTNFSSGRIGRLQTRLTYKMVKKILVDRFYKRLFNAFAFNAVIRGRLSGNLAELRKHEWVGEEVPHIQPREEARARDLDFKNGYRSLSEAIRESGRDPDEVFEEIRREKTLFAGMNGEDNAQLDGE